MEKTVEDMLRREYFDLLSSIRKTVDELEVKIRHALIPLKKTLRPHERIETRARVKECESAIDALRRREEGRIFDKSSPDKYSLCNLKDLAGVRILVFPRRYMEQIDELIAQQLPDWQPDPIKISGRLLAFKYCGYLEARSIICAEYQIVSMLIGLFWEVEHDSLYKPSLDLKGLAPIMEDTTKTVYDALDKFEEEFDQRSRESSNR